MSNIEALKKLAKRVCSTATDAALNKLNTTADVIEYIATNFNGMSAPASTASATTSTASATTSTPIINGSKLNG